MKNICRSVLAPAAALLWNLLLVYLVYQMARLEYYLENVSYFNYTFDMFVGGLLFDTSAKETGIYHNICKWVFLTVNGLTLILNLSDSVYFQYTMRRTTTTVFSEFSNESNLGSIFATELISHWYLVLLFIVLMMVLWRLYAKPQLNFRKISRWWQYDAACLLALLMVVPLCVAGMRGGFTTAVRPITISNANQYAERPVDAALVLNTPFALIRTLGKDVFIIPHYFGSEDEMAAIYTPVHHPSPTGNPGIASDTSLTKKNVVILIVESFGREYIGALNKDLDNGTYKGYTPHVDSLIAKSTTFKYSYSNGRKSIDGMPSILSSIPMFVEPFILTPASMNDFTGLAGILSAEGYETAFFHGAQNGSMGFQAFANKTGFQHYYGRTEYEAAHGTDDFDGTWAIWDEPFLQYYAEEMSRMQQPFMTAVFTASSHHPFVVPEQYKEQYPEEHLQIQKCIRYTDMAIGRFFQAASRQSWYDNTIFVLTSDHTNMSDHAEYQTDLGGFCSPIIIFDPSHPVGEVQDKIAQQIDIMPTILGMLGYDKTFFGFGIDILNTPKEETWAVNYMNGIYQYVKGDYVLQFDGQRTRAVYALSDSLMQHNLLNDDSQIQKSERELKAIIQQYMERMRQDRLKP